MKKLLFSCFLLFIILGLFSYKYCCLDKKQNILLIVVDTLSANHIPTFNKDIKIESNFISKLANSGLTFQNAYSTSSWTKPTITSILSGLYPREHGVGTLTGTLSNDVKIGISIVLLLLAILLIFYLIIHNRRVSKRKFENNFSIIF